MASFCQVEIDTAKDEFGDLGFVSRRPLSTIPIAPTPFFVDRPQITKWAYEKLEEHGQCIAFVGIEGIG